MSQGSLQIDEEAEIDNEMDSDSQVSLQGGLDARKEKLKKMIQVIFGMEGESRNMDKICCFWRINRKASAWRQLTTLFSLFITVFMASLIGFFIFFVKFSPNYVSASIFDFVDSNLEVNLRTSLMEYNKYVEIYFHSFNSQIFTMSEILSNQANWSNTLFINSNSSPLSSQSSYYRATEDIPSHLLSSSVKFYDKSVLLNTFSYLTFKSVDQSSLTLQAENILNSVDSLSYFFKSFFINPSVQQVYSLFIYLKETEIICFFPAGMVKKEANDQNQNFVLTRPWYINTLKQQLGSTSSFIITGPYLNPETGFNTITYSYPILNPENKSELKAIVNIDLVLSNFYSSYIADQDKQSDDTQVAFIDLASGLIMNSCFNSKELIHFYQTDVTGFTFSNWQDILNTTLHNSNQIFSLLNINNSQYYFIRSFIQDKIQLTKNKYMLLVFGKQSEFVEHKNEVEVKIKKELFDFGITLIITISVFWVISYLYVGVLAKYIVNPLSKLSSLAKGIYSNEQHERKNTTEDLKDRLAKVKAYDKETSSLIDAFINMIDQNSRIRKYPPTFLDSYKLNFNSFPINDYQGQLEEVKEIIQQLPNKQFKKRTASTQFQDSQKMQQEEEEDERNSDNNQSENHEDDYENDNQRQNFQQKQSQYSSKDETSYHHSKSSQKNEFQEDEDHEEDQISNNQNSFKQRLISLQKSSPDFCQQVITECLPPISSAI